MITKEKEYVFIGGRMQGKTRDLINQLISENKKLKNDYNKLVHEATEFESKVYQLQEENKRWDKLKEWVKDYRGILKIQEGSVEALDICEEHMLLVLDEIINKMEEMENNDD